MEWKRWRRPVGGVEDAPWLGRSALQRRANAASGPLVDEANHVSCGRAGTCVGQCDKRALGGIQRTCSERRVWVVLEDKEDEMPVEGQRAKPKEPWGTDFPGNG